MHNIRIVPSNRSDAANVANPLSLSIPSGFPLQLSCQSHAAFFQNVQIGTPIGIVQFTGTGEGVTMSITSGGSGTSFVVPTQPDAYMIELLFQFSKSAGGALSLSNIQHNPVMIEGALVTTISVESEDASDNDDNDSILTITIVGDGTDD